MKLVLQARVLWWLAAAAAVIAGGFSFDRMLNGFSACSDAVLNTINSPDGSKVIVIFRKECNATVPYMTQASIAPAGLISSAEKASPFFIVAGTPVVMADWHGDHAVGIALIPGGGKVLRSQQSVGDIKIEYK